MEKLYIELVRGNSSILDSMGSTEIEHVVLNLLKTSHNPLLLDLLSAICFSNGAARIRHQNLITKVLLEDERARGTLYTLSLEAETVFISVDGDSAQKQSLQEFVPTQ